MDPDEARRHLEAERERLAAVRAGFDDEGLDDSQTDSSDSSGELASYDQDPADLGTETFEREKDVSIIERVEAELADVEHALGRIDEGTYGVCEACGKPIDEARLDALPAARLCLDDQARAENQARFGA